MVLVAVQWLNSWKSRDNCRVSLWSVWTAESLIAQLHVHNAGQECGRAGWVGSR